MDLINDCQVDPEVGRNDTGSFLFLNLATMEVKFRIPPNERKRVNREKLRKVLLKDVEESVQWGKRLVDVRAEPSQDEATAVFEYGSEVTGSFIVGAEGGVSCTREFLRPDAHRNEPLDVKFLGTAIDMTPDEVRPLRDLDPLLFQGCHPVTGTFLWVSILETPAVNGTAGTGKERYRVQLGVSWRTEPTQSTIGTPTTGLLAEMKRRAQGFALELWKVIDGIPEDAVIQEIVPADWPCLNWQPYAAVTLAGDAAHLMTMYRGEAANHGFLDALLLYRALKGVHDGSIRQGEAIRKYEDEMRERAKSAVLLSRQACLDAHDWEGLNEASAVLRKRQLPDV
jgi:2-polyprenyl-6-methoxyphenol hydroxylase-like FAD-dependent oxidoreductase